MTTVTRIFISALAVLVLSGCVNSQVIWQSASAEPLGAEKASIQPAQENGKGEILNALLEAIEFADITYADNLEIITNRREAASRRFAELGYDSMYYHPKFGWFARTPNLFLLSRPQTNHIYLVVHGTELLIDPVDMLTNFASGIAGKDELKNNYLYLPVGHAGFRNAAKNLIVKGLLTSDMQDQDIGVYCSNPALAAPETAGNLQQARDGVSLLDYICANNVFNADLGSKVEVTLVGHSQGAGIIQLIIGAIDGLMVENVQVDGTYDVIRAPQWPFSLKRAFLFAPPLAVYNRERESCTRITNDESPITIDSKFGIPDRTYTVIHRGDMIPTIWNPLSTTDVHCVLGEHFGKFVDITRKGSMSISDDVDWAYERPHHTGTYLEAIKSAIDEQ